MKMKRHNKGIISVILVLGMLLCMSTTSIASTIENNRASGEPSRIGGEYCPSENVSGIEERNEGESTYSELSLKYFVFDPSTEKKMDNLQITDLCFLPNDAAISITLIFDGNDYSFLLNKTDRIKVTEGFQCYESFGTNSYCLCMHQDGIVSGMLRVFSGEDSYQMDSVAFVASNDQNIIDYLSDTICKPQLVEAPTIYLFNDNMQKSASVFHASVFAGIGDHFAEFWTSVDFNASERVTRVTQYNINTNIIGDGCYLRKRNISTDYVYTLWASPTLPPQGLQMVSNETHYISYEYVGMMDVTVTGYLIISLPDTDIPLPLIRLYADGVEF